MANSSYNQFSATTNEVSVVETTGDTTLTLANRGSIFVSTDSVPINFFLPSGLPAGYTVRSYQGGSGQISYVATTGATIVDGQLRSQGRHVLGYYVEIQNLGDDQWIVLGNTTEGVLEWSLVGSTTIREGDAGVYALWIPDVAQAEEAGVTIQITGTDVDTAGFDYTLAEAIDELVRIEPLVSFDGVDTLTILPGARNPLPLQFFAIPTYTNIGDRTCSITISNASVGDINLAAATVTTTVQNISKPHEPDDLFDVTTTTTSVSALSGATALTLTSSSGFELFGVVTHANIPALTYITAINNNTITLSAAITGDIASGQTITHTEPGYHFDFSSTDNITIDGSNKCSVATDTIHGYTIEQATGSLQPLYVASLLNGHGGMRFNAAGVRLSTTNAGIATMINAARSACTYIVVGTVEDASSTGFWLENRYGLTAQSSGSPFQRSTSASIEVRNSSTVNTPYIWSWVNDGSDNGGQVMCNGRRIYIPATLTADAASGQKIVTLDDTSSLVAGMFVIPDPYGGLKSTSSTSNIAVPAANFYLITSVDSSTQITLNQNIQSGGLKSGQRLRFTSLAQSTGEGGAAAGSATTLTIGTDNTGSNRFKGVIHEILMMPKIITPQKMRGFIKRCSAKYSTSTSTTTTASASAGDMSVVVADTTNIRLYQTVSGTNIKTGTTVIKINTTTKEVTFDEAIETGGVSSGATLDFHNCSFKQPELLDITEFNAAYRNDFANGTNFANSGDGMQPYYGDIASPGTFPSAYGAVGHGSSNGGSAEKEWYLDVYNYAPWLRYNPFSQFKNSDVPKGGLKITASPTPAAIADLVGYSPPQPTAYTYISGYMKDAGGFSQTYGYWESRIKYNKVLNSWGAFWLTVSNGVWPSEVDISEFYGANFGLIHCTVHANLNFDVSSTNRSMANYGDVIVDASEEYALFGFKSTPTEMTFYLNREKLISFVPQWDFHVPWLMQLNMAVEATHGGETPDNVTEMPMYIDYAAAWAIPPQTLSPTGSTQAETTALLAAMSVAPSAGRETLINTMIEKLKLYQTDHAGSLWDALDMLIVTAAHDEQAGRIDWKDPSRVCSKVGTPVFETDRGYVGVVDTSYLLYGYTLSTESFNINSTLNQRHIGCVSRDIVNTTSVALGTTNFSINPRSSGTLRVTMWGAAKTPTISKDNGHFLAVRNHFQYAYYKNGEFVSTRGTNGSGSNTMTTDTEQPKIANGTSRVCCVHAGDFLTQNDAAGLYAIIYEYMSAVGAL